MSKPVTAARSLGTLAAAASAVTFSGPEAAHAQGLTPFATPVPHAWSLEGGFIVSNYSRSAFPNGPSLDKLGADTLTLPDPGRNYGFYGAASVSKSIDAIYDWRLTGAFNVFKANQWSSSASASGGFPVFSETRTIVERDKFNFLTFDFDVGRRFDQGDLHLRTFAGLRVLHSEDRLSVVDSFASDTKLGSFSDTTTWTGKSSFTGVGPRAGLDMFYGSTWGVVGSLSAAAIFGFRNADLNLASPFLTKGSQANWSQRTTDWVGNISGSLGIATYLTPTTMAVLGYRADGWFNMRDKFDFAPMDFNRKTDFTTHTFFLRVQVRQSP